MKFGDIEIFLIADGNFRLDGGGMFGVVPKVLWSKSDPPDDCNRILLGANNLLIKQEKNVILVDNGLGSKWDEKRRDMFDIDFPRQLIGELAVHGVQPEDVTHMVCSHLHFDHVGGGTYKDEDGELRTQFPNAKYYIQKGEWEAGLNPNPRDRASYLPDNLNPIKDEGLLELVEGDVEIAPGVKMIVTGGHTKHHCIIKVESGGYTAVFLADLIPTASHVHIPFVMGYDLYPETTMAYKSKFLEEAYENNHLLVFEHGPRFMAGHLEKDDRGKWRIKRFDMDTEDYAKVISESVTV